MIVAASVAAGGDSGRSAAALGDASRSDTTAALRAYVSGHAHPSVPLGLDFFDTSIAPGTALPGSKLISHLGGGRRARKGGDAGSRMIYTGKSAFEPTLGIDKAGNIFYQGGLNDGVPIPVVSVSQDGGRSWEEVTPETHQHTVDPMLYLDPSTGRVFIADLTYGTCITTSHSDDLGGSWTTSEACGLTDHQNVFAGPPVTSQPVGYPNVVYMCAIDGGTLAWGSTATSCQKSLDGGLTWARTGAPAYTDDPSAGVGDFGIPGACGGAAGHGVVDSKGIVYLPRGWCEQPHLAISKDEGLTWERVKVADLGMPQGLSDRTGLYWDHEAAVAVDRKGNIYYFWVARDRLPYLAVSSDGGKTFAKPIMVGRPGLKEAWGPKIEVGKAGRIAMAYVGSTTAPGGKSPNGVGDKYDQGVTWNGYITTSVDALAKRPRFFTTSVNRPADPLMRGECGATACGVQLDFIDLVIDRNGRPWSSMVDGCPAPGKVCDINPGLGFVGTVTGGPKLR